MSHTFRILCSPIWLATSPSGLPNLSLVIVSTRVFCLTQTASLFLSIPAKGKNDRVTYLLLRL